MSGEATGFVWRHSPYLGGALLVHLAVADVVNDVHGNEFWMSTEKLAKKARVSRSTAVAALRVMVKDGYLEQLERGGESRKPSRYRFTTSAVVALARPAIALDKRDQDDSTSAVVAHNTKENSKNTTVRVSDLPKTPPPWRDSGTDPIEWARTNG